MNDTFEKSLVKTRQKWLISTVVYFFLYPVSVFTVFYLLSIQHPFPRQSLLASLGITIAGLVMVWALYECAYKKHGTKLLSFCLLAGQTFVLVRNIHLLSHPFDLWATLALVVEFSLYIWWRILSLKLKHYNKLVQAHHSQAIHS